MGNLEETKKNINKMRQALYEMIEIKENLLDIEVINASQRLDLALNEYNELYQTIE